MNTLVDPSEISSPVEVARARVRPARPASPADPETGDLENIEVEDTELDVLVEWVPEEVGPTPLDLDARLRCWCSED
jgi:hypothetical protein